MTFTLVFPRRPPSGNKGPNRKFQAALRLAATARLAGGGLLGGDLYCRITWFHAVKTTQDVDNIAKNILDSLKGVVFADDRAIVQCLATRIDTRRDYTIVPNAAFADVIDELIDALAQGHVHVLYIEAGPVTAQRAVFGPIDGGES
jgi:Endodeoxyribonuclease RusA